MEKYILGNIRKVIYKSPNGSYTVGIFKVRETNLISFKSTSDDFTMRIIYYDKDGNQYD